MTVFTTVLDVELVPLELELEPFELELDLLYARVFLEPTLAG